MNTTSVAAWLPGSGSDTSSPLVSGSLKLGARVPSATIVEGVSAMPEPSSPGRPGSGGAQLALELLELGVDLGGSQIILADLDVEIRAGLRLAVVARADRLLRPRAGPERHLLLERLELAVDARAGGQRLELRLERGLGQGPELGRRLGLGLELSHALVHPREGAVVRVAAVRSEEHTSELQSRENLVCRLLLEKKKKKHQDEIIYT